MNKYRFLPTSTWSDDIFLNMSPEQKLIYLYLITSPYTSLCGIFKVSVSTMGHFIGLRNGTIQSAFSAFLMKYADLVRYDDITGEVAILYWPKFALVNANIKAMKKAQQDLEDVQSIELLQEVISRNSARLSAMYLKRLRQIQVERINASKMAENYGNVLQSADNEAFNAQREIEIEKEIESIVSDSDESDHVPDPLKDTGNGKPGENNSADDDENSGPPAAEFPFQVFWDAYDHKVGRAKSEKKWKRLSRTEKREAMRVLPWYVADTVKDDTEQHGDVWRPRRQNPLTWLNGAGWRDYEDADGPRIKDQAQAPGNGKAGNTGPVIRVPSKNKSFSITELPD